MEAPTKKFLDALPAKIGKPCGPKILEMVRTRLSASDPEKPFEPTDQWVKEFTIELAKPKDSHPRAVPTRYVYQDILNDIFTSWLNAGLIDEIPDFEFSHQDHRTLVVDPGKIDYPLCDYQVLSSHALALICGRTNDILQPPARKGGIYFLDEQSLLTQLMFILSGYCSYDPISDLNQLTWEDVHMDERMPYRIPNGRRTSYIWFQPSLLSRLMSACLKFRTITDQKDEFKASNSVFSDKSTSLALGKKLKGMCNSLNIKQAHVYDLIEPTRLKTGALFPHNSYLAVINGQIPHQSIPAFYVPAFFGISDVTPLVPFKSKPSTDDIDIDPLWEEIQEPPDFYKMVELSDQLNSELIQIYNTHRDYFFTSDDPRWRSYLSDKTGTVQPDKSDVVIYNLFWILKWVLWMEVEKDPKKPLSRRAYFFNLLRFFNFFPFIHAEEINTAAIRIFIYESGFSKSTLNGTKTAIKSFLTFLSNAGKKVSLIRFEKIHIPRDHDPVGILLDNDIILAVEKALDANTRMAIGMGDTFALRISETGKSSAANLELEGDPFLVVEKSKRGKTGIVAALSADIPLDLITEAMHANIPFDNIRVSENFSKSLPQNNGEGGRKKFHWIRARRLTIIFMIYGWITASKMARHSSAITLCEYVHVIDLLAAKEMKKSTYKIHQNLHIPFSTLAAFLGYTTIGLNGLLKDFQKCHNDEPLPIQGGDQPDIMDEFSDGVNHPEEMYIQISDAYQLVKWAIEQERYKKRGREK